MVLMWLSLVTAAIALIASPATPGAAAATRTPHTVLRMSGGEVEMPQKPIPVTLLSGFLGAGKTTLLRHLLENTEGVRIGVIVNDVAAINVDSKLVQRDAETGVAQPEDMVELSNGCACCSAGDDLFGALSELVSNCFMRGKVYDHIIFEASGVAEPKLLREAFQEATAAGWPLMSCISLETMVTVVDASSFLELYSSIDPISDRADLGGGETEDEPALEVWQLPDEAPPAPSVVQLLVEQVETADVLVLNKVDGVDAAGRRYLEEALGAINGFAELLPTTFGQVTPSQVLIEEREAGVAASNDVMDHQSSVDFAKWLQANARVPPPPSVAEEIEEMTHSHGHASEDSHSHAHEHSHATEHSHAHEHSHADGGACDDPACTDPTHDHSHDSATCTDPTHDHSHDSATCTDPTHDHSHDSATCTDPTHDHSHDSDRQQTTAATRFGITTFVYAARRPFIVARFERLLGGLPFVRVVPPNAPAALDWFDDCQKDGAGAAATPPAADGSGGGAFADVLRSKGFVWLADDSSLAFYWSQAGKQLELSQMGRWWAAVPRASWPSAHISSIEADCEGAWGDRRQELIFIGANLDEARIVAALDECLATDAELEALTKQHAVAGVPAAS